MARVPFLSRDQVPEELRGAFDRATSGRGDVIRTAPGSVMINSPEMYCRGRDLQSFLREESSLAKKTQELAMLTAARAMDCQYVWYAHAASGRAAGLPDALVDALRDRQPIPVVAEEEAIVVKYGQEFYDTHRISQDTFDTALRLFGAQGLTELSTLMGFYALLAFNANAFEIDLPDDGYEPVLPV